MNSRIFPADLVGSEPIHPLDLRELCARIKLKRSAALSRWNRKSKYYDPTFPKPFRLGEGTRKLYWVESEVNVWLNTKAGDRQASEG